MSASAVGLYGKHGDERVAEYTPPGDDFLAEVCVAWEREARAAGDRGARRPHAHRRRPGPAGGALEDDAAALPRRRRRAGGGGRQYMPWIHVDDVVGMYLRGARRRVLVGSRERHRPRAGDQPRLLQGASAGRCTGPAVAPVPAFALRVLYGDMAEIVTEGQRAVPGARTGARLRVPTPELDDALAAALA